MQSHKTCLVALNFVCDNEASSFYDAITGHLRRKHDLLLKKKQEAKLRDPLSREKKENTDDSVVLRRQQQHQTSVEEKQNLKDLFGPNRVQAKKVRGKINKDLIGTPSNFVHVAHVGFQSEKGFNTYGEVDVFQQVLQKAGMLDAYVRNMLKIFNVYQILIDSFFLEY